MNIYRFVYLKDQAKCKTGDMSSFSLEFSFQYLDF